MSKPQTLDEILEDILLYEPCRDYSCKGACHQVKIDQSKAALSSMVEEIIGRDESAYSDDHTRYFEHIAHQNNTRKLQRERAEQLGFIIGGSK